MEDRSTLLLSLRDIHIPQAPESASITWLLVSALVIVIIAFIVYWLHFRRKRAALYEVRRILNNVAIDSPHVAMELATVLRRIVHQTTGEKINRLQNQAWLEQLDQHFSTQYFTQGNGQIFGEALYKKSNSELAFCAQDVRAELTKLIKFRHLKPHV